MTDQEKTEPGCICGHSWAWHFDLDPPGMLPLLGCEYEGGCDCPGWIPNEEYLMELRSTKDD